MNLKYTILESLFKLRHSSFESLHTGRLKYFMKQNVPNVLQKYLFNKKLKSIKQFPENIVIETTSICNAKCWFCPQPTMTRKASYMDFGLFKKLIKEIRQNMKYVKNIGLFMDGEPTLHKELLKFLRYARSKNINKIYLSSNMEYFTPKFTDELFASDLGDTLLYVICSLDGVSPDTHRQTRINVDYEKAVANTEYLIKAKKDNKANYPWVFTRLLVNELTKDEADQFVKKWQNKADKVLVSKMHNWGGQIDDNRIIDIESTVFGSTCYLPFSQIVIQFDGNSRLCCVDTNGTALTGDLNSQSIKQVWDGMVLSEYRRGQLEKNSELLPYICENCTYPSKGQWNEPFYWS